MGALRAALHGIGAARHRDRVPVGRNPSGSTDEKRALLAIRLAGAEGDITGTDHVVWIRRRGTPYVPSPLLYGDALYFLAHYQGILTRVVAKTGDERSGPLRLGGIRNVYASPVGAAGRVYITDRNGTTMVISHAASMIRWTQSKATSTALTWCEARISVATVAI